jgi:hypothetical protein
MENLSVYFATCDTKYLRKKVIGETWSPGLTLIRICIGINVLCILKCIEATSFNAEVSITRKQFVNKRFRKLTLTK